MFIRAIHFGSCLIFQSVFVLLFLAVIPGWKESAAGDALPPPRYLHLLQRLAVICLFTASVSGFLWLWFSIASMSDSGLVNSLQPGLFWMVLTETQPGRAWLLRAGIALVCAIALFFVFGAKRAGKASWWPLPLCALSSVALTVSLAWLGHAAASEEPNQNLHLAGDLLHLFAAGIWPAGLAPFAIFLICFLKARDPSLLLAACLATRRFSSLSYFAVGALMASGVANSYFLVGTFHALVTTEYGLLLVLKIVLSGVAIGFGGWNLLTFKPRLATPGGSLPGRTQITALAKVARNVWIEIGVAALILIVVGLLGIMPPATHP
jgi:copper resistance protein D